MLSDLRSALHHLRQRPSHVAAGVVSLGVGMAVCVSAFSLFNTPLAAARAELAVHERRLVAMPSSRQHTSLRVFRSGLAWRDEPRESLLALLLYLCLPVSVLGIGCVNVVNLQLARAMDRAGELSVRLALGASRLRLMRLLAVETALLAAVAAGVGWAGARTILARVAAFFPATLAIDPSVFLFASCLIVLTIGAGGVFPAWIAARDVIAAGLRLQQGTRGRTRMRGLLIIVQVAASLALVVLSDLALRSILARTPAIPASAARILVADINLTDVHPTAPRPRVFLDAVLDRLRDQPSIDAAAFSTFVAGGHQVFYRLASDGAELRRFAMGGFVTSDWFAATQATFLMGRAPQRHLPTAREVVVNAAFAASFPGTPQNALGLRMVMPDGPAEVVGIIADTEWSPAGAAVPMIFAPMPAVAPATLTLVAHVRDASAGRDAIAAAIRATDPAIPIVRIDSLDVRTAEQLHGAREMAWFGLSLGLVALTLAGIGLHSLLSYIIRRRTQEVGIRLTMGAQTSDIVWLCLKPALSLLLAGAAAGVALAIGVAQLIQSALAGVSAFDATGLLTTAGVLAGVAILATGVPAYRAARVDPVEALRSE